MSGFKSRPSRQMAGFPTRLLSVILAVRQHFHRAESRRLSNSMVEFRPIKPELQVRLLRPTRSLARLPFTTGRRIGLSPTKRVVAGSSPAFGSRRRSSSVVEHVIPSSFLIRRSFQRAVDGGLSWTRQWRCKSAPRSNPRWCNASTPSNSTVAFLSAVFLLIVSCHFDGPKLWVIACCRFESDLPRSGAVAQW